ncbi:MAG: DsbA family protein [Patescibacteria group bacterium]
MEIVGEKKSSRPWWVAPTIALGALAILVSGFFAAQVWYYLRLLQSGEAVDLQFTSRFTAAPTSVGAGGAGNAQVFDVASADDPALGAADAPLTIVEFADFECPFSKDESTVVRELAARYPDRVRFIYRDFPLSDIHPHAERAALAGACAHEQGKFWAMHDKMFQNALALTDSDLKRYALEIGLNAAQFDSCLLTEKYRDEVRADYEAGVAAGVRGTPTFFIAGRKVEGAIPAPIFEQIIKQLTKGYVK